MECLRFGPPLQPPGGPSVIQPRAALGHVLLLGGGLLNRAFLNRVGNMKKILKQVWNTSFPGSILGLITMKGIIIHRSAAPCFVLEPSGGSHLQRPPKKRAVRQRAGGDGWYPNPRRGGVGERPNPPNKGPPWIIGGTRFFGPSGVDFYSGCSPNIFCLSPFIFRIKGGGLLFGPFFRGPGSGLLFGHGTNKGGWTFQRHTWNSVKQRP